MLFLNLAVLAGEKYLAKNFCASASQIVPGAREFNNIFALSLREKGNNLRQMASSVIPICLNVSKTFRKFAIC